MNEYTEWKNVRSLFDTKFIEFVCFYQIKWHFQAKNLYGFLNVYIGFDQCDDINNNIFCFVFFSFAFLFCDYCFCFADIICPYICLYFFLVFRATAIVAVALAEMKWNEKPTITTSFREYINLAVECIKFYVFDVIR